MNMCGGFGKRTVYSFANDKSYKSPSVLRIGSWRKVHGFRQVNQLCYAGEELRSVAKYSPMLHIWVTETW